jgi:hypothetical protein
LADFSRRRTPFHRHGLSDIGVMSTDCAGNIYTKNRRNCETQQPRLR